MFSIFDLDRYRRWPLLWVFVPLILGGLLVTLLAFGLHAARGFPDRELAEKIHGAGQLRPGGRLEDITGFAWDSVCIFVPSASTEDVDETIGIDWSRAAGSSVDDELLLVFLEEGAVVTHAYVVSSVLPAPTDDGECRAPGGDGTRIQSPRESLG